MPEADRGLAFLGVLTATKLLDGDPLATLQATPLQDVAAVLGAAALAETMDLAVLPLLRLIGTLRHISLKLAEYNEERVYKPRNRQQFINTLIFCEGFVGIVAHLWMML